MVGIRKTLQFWHHPHARNPHL